MIVAIHQPNFLPWLGFFYKMLKADRFVFLDSVPFSKGSYTNRVKIKTAQGVQWLTVPVLTKGKSAQTIAEVATNTEVCWRDRVVKTLEGSYGKCNCFWDYFPDLRDIITTHTDSLVHLNLKLIRHIMVWLEIDVPVLQSSRMLIAGTSTRRLINICKHCSADTYLSGAGGNGYQDESVFNREGVKLCYSDFVHPTYPQRFDKFVPGLSIVDLLFNCGPDSRRILECASLT